MATDPLLQPLIQPTSSHPGPPTRVELDPALPTLHFDDRYFREPHETVAPLLAAGARAAHVPELGTLIFLRQDDVAGMLQDRRFGAMNSRYYEQQGWSEGPYIDWIHRTLVFLDPPDHDRLRGLLARAFTPRQVARITPITEQIAESLASDAAEARTVDLYDSFAQKLPLQVICSLLAAGYRAWPRCCHQLRIELTANWAVS